MTAKTYLLSVRKAEHELKLIQDQRRHFNDLIASIGAQMKAAVVQTSGNTSKTETAAIGLVDLEGKLKDKEMEYTALVETAWELLDKIKQDNFREVLTRRYLMGESWPTITDKMGYANKNCVHWAHRHALKEFQKLLDVPLLDG